MVQLTTVREKGEKGRSQKINEKTQARVSELREQKAALTDSFFALLPRSTPESSPHSALSDGEFGVRFIKYTQNRISSGWRKRTSNVGEKAARKNATQQATRVGPSGSNLFLKTFRIHHFVIFIKIKFSPLAWPSTTQGRISRPVIASRFHFMPVRWPVPALFFVCARVTSTTKLPRFCTALHGMASEGGEAKRCCRECKYLAISVASHQVCSLRGERGLIIVARFFAINSRFFINAGETSLDSVSWTKLNLQSPELAWLLKRRVFPPTSGRVDDEKKRRWQADDRHSTASSQIQLITRKFHHPDAPGDLLQRGRVIVSPPRRLVDLSGLAFV